MAESIFWRKSVGGRSGASKNSPGTASLVPKKRYNQNLFWELSEDPGELKEYVEPNSAQLHKLKGRILKNNGTFDHPVGLRVGSRMRNFQHFTDSETLAQTEDVN